MSYFDTSNLFNRYRAATAAAVVMTGTLFWIMQSAIENEGITVGDPPRGSLLPWVRLDRDQDPVTTKRNKPEPPPPVAQHPPKPDALTETEGQGYRMEAYTPPLPDNGPYDPGARADGEALPVVTVAPEYPRRPLSQGVEGWVIVEFIIDKLGRVQDARVVDAQPSRVFDNAALKAVQRYKYKPKVLNGQAVPVHGVRHRIVFELS